MKPGSKDMNKQHVTCRFPFSARAQVLWVHLVSSRRFGLFQTQDTFTIYEDVWDEINYVDTGRPSPNGKGDLFKRCEVPGEPKASYICGNHGFSCAITGDKDGDDKDKDGKNPRAWATWAQLANLKMVCSANVC